MRSALWSAYIRKERVKQKMKGPSAIASLSEGKPGCCCGEADEAPEDRAGISSFHQRPLFLSAHICRLNKQINQNQETVEREKSEMNFLSG